MTSLSTLSALLVVGTVAFAGVAEAAPVAKKTAPAAHYTVIEGRNATSYALPGVAANANTAIQQQVELNMRSTH